MYYFQRLNYETVHIVEDQVIKAAQQIGKYIVLHMTRHVITVGKKVIFGKSAFLRKSSRRKRNMNSLRMKRKMKMRMPMW